MNERIRELVREAGIKSAPDILVIIREDDGTYTRSWTSELDKFVELIVKECEIALNPMLRDMISRGQACELIRKHFKDDE